MIRSRWYTGPKFLCKDIKLWQKIEPLQVNSTVLAKEVVQIEYRLLRWRSSPIRQAYMLKERELIPKKHN